MSIATFINKINKLGIKLWLDNGQLKFKAPKGTWNAEIRDELVANKEKVIAHLQNAIERDQIPAIHSVERASIDGKPSPEFPLSFSQERLWFIDQMEPHSASYNIPIAVTIRSEIPGDRASQAMDIKLVTKAFNLIIARHENLRTIFPSKNGKAQQRILERTAFNVEFLDIQDSESEKQRTQTLQKICQDEASTSFDLTKGPLLRVTLCQLTAKECVLILNIHHIISDGWSMGIIVKEFTSIMDAFRLGKKPLLPPLPIQYVDYSIWQRQWLAGDACLRHGENTVDNSTSENNPLQQQLIYWKKKLEGVPESLDLPTDFTRTTAKNSAGAKFLFNLDLQLTQRLNNIAEQHECSLFMVLLTVFNVLLHRYSHQEDICVGTPVANRHHEGTESLIGFFINTLVLRNQVTGDSRFSELLSQVKQTCFEAFEHQDAPFEKVVDLMQSHRNAEISPLFQVMFVLQNARRESLGDGLNATPVDMPVSKFDMTLEFIETVKGLDGVIEFKTSLFRQQTIERLAGHFTALCWAVILATDANISELEFISTSEKQQLLIDYNNTQTDYPDKQCIHELFVEQVKRSPDKIAVEYQTEVLSYRQLYEKSHDLAIYLQSQGVKPDDLVGICVGRSLEMIVGILGILQAGGAYVPLESDYPKERLAYILEDSQVNIVLTQDRLREKLSNLVERDTQFIALDKQWPMISHSVDDLKAKKVKLQRDVNPHHLAYVIYTSGSTGQPKGVMIEHKSVVNTVSWFIENFQISEKSKLIQLTDYTFDPSVEDFFGALASGALLYIPSKHLIMNEKKLVDYLIEKEITGLNFVPGVLKGILSGHSKLESIDFVVSGGEKLDESVKDAILEKEYHLFNNYGPTETSIDALSERCIEGRVTIGKPISNTQVYVLDQYENLQPIGVPGELCIAGQGLARGYLNRPELTKEKFIDNPFQSGTRMYKSGDLVRWSENGNIEYLGRTDTQVKIRGFRIELGEIEAQLVKYPGLEDSVVVAHGSDSNKRLIAFYVLRDTRENQVSSPQHEDLGLWLRKILPDYMLPSAFVSLDEIPLTRNGKVDRRALEKIDISLEAIQVWIAPRNAMEKQLVAIWSEVLGTEPEKIGVNDNFFELGGDSIKTIQITSKAIENQIYFDVRDMFNHQTIAELLQHCDVTKSQEIVKEEGVLVGVVDLSPIQSNFFEHTQTDLHHFNQSVLLNLKTSLSIDDLTALCAHLTFQHDALRLRYSPNNAGWQQRYISSTLSTPDTLGISSYDISNLDKQKIAGHVESICNTWQTQLDPENGPVMRWIWFDAKDNHTEDIGYGQLAIIIHHLVIDGVSWRILLEDLNSLIGQQLAKQPLALPDKRSSYRNWVDSLASYNESEQGQKDLAFWVAQSAKAQCTENAFEQKVYRNQDIRPAEVQLSKSHTEQLLKHCHQAYGTEINDLLLTAMMMSYYQSTGNNSLLVDIEGHGREQLDPTIDVTKTLGWFTSIYPVNFQLSNPHNIGQSIREIKATLHAIPNKGIGYSIFRYVNQHEVVKNMPEAQVVFNFLGDFNLDSGASTDHHFSLSKSSSGATSSQKTELDKLVAINGMIVFGQLSFTFSYPKQWQGQSMSQWQAHFISTLKELIEHCAHSPRIGYTPSDFPLLSDLGASSSASLTQIDSLSKTMQQQDIQFSNVQDVFPLTPLQSGMLFETLLAETEDNKGMYLTQTAIGVRGQVDTAALQQAWQYVVNHYDALRMQVLTDVPEFNESLQVILKQVNAEINLVDWTDRPEANLRSACDLWMAESKRSGISFKQGPMMRMCFFQGREHSYLLFEQHHIMLDGWSQNIVLSNLFKLYQALIEQQDYQLPLTPPYGEYVKTLLNRSPEQEAAFWKDYLRCHESRTPLPLEGQSSKQGSTAKANTKDAFETLSLSLSIENTAQLEQLVRKHRLTMNTVLQFTWGLLMHLHSGNEAVTFGSVSSGRTGLLNVKYSNQLVGLCINTTPTCIYFDAELSLLEQLKQMQIRESEKLNYEVTPLVHIQELSGISSNEDFFQTLFVYENYPVEKITEANDLIVDFVGNEAPNYPMSVVAASLDTLTLSLTWDSHYYNKKTISTLMAQYERLIQQLITVPEGGIKDLSLVSDLERHQLLVDFNQTHLDYPKDKCIHQLFTEQAVKNPNKTAVVFENEVLSYQQLHEQSHKLALFLQCQGVRPDTLVGLCVERSLDMIVAMLGVLKAGGAYVPLDPLYPADRLNHMLEDSQVTIVLTQETLKSKLTHAVTRHIQFITLDAQRSEINEHATKSKAEQVTLRHAVKPDHLSYVIYTSGSTGKPKGVAIEHRNAVALINWAQAVYGEKELSGVLASTSISFDLSIFEIFLTLATGGKIILVSNILELSNLSQKSDITLINTVPSAMEELITLNLIPASVNTVNLAGEPLSPTLVDKIYNDSAVHKVYDLYGPSEDTTYSTYSLRDKNGPQTIGRPISNTQIYILNSYNNPVPIGVPGELHVAGDGLSRGYLNRPEVTQEKFVAIPFGSGKNQEHTRMYKTGDLARWTEDGNIEYLGRIDTQVKIRGFRIELGEIEEQLNSHPEVKDTAVVAHRGTNNVRLVAYYVAGKSSDRHVVELERKDLAAHLQQTLPDYMVPSVFVSLEIIPLTPNGKVDRRALERIDVSLESSRGYLAPRNHTEQELVAIWAGVLQLSPEKIGVYDDFFELGGQSLLAIQVISRIRTQLAVDVPMKALFSANTIADIAEVIHAIQGQHEQQFQKEGPDEVEFEETTL